MFHGNDLSYSVVSRTDNTLFPKNINGTYSAIANALTAGLRHLGINPDPADKITSRKAVTAEYHKARLCFSTAIRHEITVHGKKLIGSAQRRWPDVFLQHGSILVNGPSAENGPASISLNELGVFSSDVKLFAASMSQGFTEAFDIQLMTDKLSDYELKLSDRLIVEKYARL